MFGYVHVEWVTMGYTLVRVDIGFKIQQIYILYSKREDDEYFRKIEKGTGRLEML